jgi:hypothetical protein
MGSSMAGRRLVDMASRSRRMTMIREVTKCFGSSLLSLPNKIFDVAVLQALCRLDQLVSACKSDGKLPSDPIGFGIFASHHYEFVKELCFPLLTRNEEVFLAKLR